MALSLETTDGKEVTIEKTELPEDVQANLDSFKRAQANDPIQDDKTRPPKRAPRELAEDKTDPGYTPNKRGRPSKADQARTTSKAPAPAAKQEPLKPKDYRENLTAVTDMAWFGGSTLPFVSKYTAPYAAVLKSNQTGIVESLNQAANSNATARKYVEKFAGDGGNASGAMWMINLAMVGATALGQCVQIATNKEFRDQVVDANAQALEKYVTEVLPGMMAQAQAQQAA
jgi:hypothetical protein